MMVKSQERLKLHSLSPTVLASNIHSLNSPEKFTFAFEAYVIDLLIYWPPKALECLSLVK